MSVITWLFRHFSAFVVVVSITGIVSASTFSFPPVSQGTVTDPAIDEASGFVASPDNPGVLWTENDSNNPNTIFALDTSGHLLGTYYLDGVTNYDWEDMSVGPGPEPGVNYLYLANSASPAPGAGWNLPGFNDSSWSSGSGPFGYGQGNEHTLLSYGNSPNNKPASDAFRTTFTIANPHLLTDLTLKLLVDDGAAVYLNGTQIERFNLAADATLNTFAQSSVSNAFQNSWRTFTFNNSLLLPGTNTLAVEVHGSSAADNDLRFDAQISAIPVTPTTGDFNLDGHVDASDITSMLAAMADLNKYQSDTGLSPAQLTTIADVNGNSAINNADIQALLYKLHNGGGGTAPVPEPPTLVLALIALVEIWHRRSRVDK